MTDGGLLIRVVDDGRELDRWRWGEWPIPQTGDEVHVSGEWYNVTVVSHRRDAQTPNVTVRVRPIV